MPGPRHACTQPSMCTLHLSLAAHAPLTFSMPAPASATHVHARTRPARCVYAMRGFEDWDEGLGMCRGQHQRKLAVSETRNRNPRLSGENGDSDREEVIVQPPSPIMLTMYELLTRATNPPPALGPPGVSFALSLNALLLVVQRVAGAGPMTKRKKAPAKQGMAVVPKNPRENRGAAGQKRKRVVETSDEDTSEDTSEDISEDEHPAEEDPLPR
ncbi:hypothetical protein OF83DRAFT_1089008 [Amylostereum chailletii]|nr:hypothetical protein OF83DRAFT_1089008 [Amylostereum chailletii]